jgi:hypothetical protein
MRYHVWCSLILFAACAEESLPVEVPPSGDLVGTWRYMPFYPDRTPVEEREIVVFGADGLYSIRDPDGSQSGSYELAGHDITIRSSAGAWITTGVAVNGDRLIIDALFPAGPSDGLIGTWGAELETDTRSSRWSCGPTARPFEQTGTLRREATWIQDDPYALVMFAGTTRTKAYPALPDFAIGEWLYERVP